MDTCGDAKWDYDSHPIYIRHNTNEKEYEEVCERDKMDIAIIFKIAAVGIIVTILGQVLKQSGRDEQAFLLSLVGLIIVMFWVVPYISELFETMETLFMLG